MEVRVIKVVKKFSSDSTDNTKWRTSDICGAEYSLVASNRKAELYRNGIFQRSFTYKEEIKEAIVAELENGNLNEGFVITTCVFTSSCGHFYEEGGKEYVIDAPFEVKSLRCGNKGCIILEPRCFDLQSYPRLFVLSHPLDGFKPVHFSLNSIKGNLQLVSDLHPDDSECWLATKDNQHLSLWALRNTLNENRKEVTDCNKFEFVLFWEAELAQYATEVSNVFLADLSSTSKLLCIFGDRTLTALTYQYLKQRSFATTFVWQKQCLASSSVEATRHGLLDVLCLEMDMTLQVCVGGDTWIPCYFVSGLEELDNSFKSSKRQRNSLPLYQHGFVDRRNFRVVDIITSTRHRSTLKLSNGNIIEVSIPPLTTSELVQKCIVVLSNVLPSTVFPLILENFSIELNNVSKNTKICEWECFANLLLSLYLPHTSDLTEFSSFSFYSSSHTSFSADNVLNSLLSQSNVLENSKKESKFFPDVKSSNPLYKVSPLIFISLHMLYEDFRLSVLSARLGEDLVELLIQIAYFCEMKAYLQYYMCNSPFIWEKTMEKINQNIDLVKGPENGFLHQLPEFYESPPSVYSWISTFLEGKSPNYKLLKDIRHEFGISQYIYPLGEACTLTTKIITLLQSNSHTPEFLMELVRQNFHQEELNMLPVGIRIPIQIKFDSCCEYPNQSWPLHTFKLIGRMDYATNFCGAKVPKFPEYPKKKEIKDVHSICQSTLPSSNSPTSKHFNNHFEELTLVFNKDKRIFEAMKLLDFSRTCILEPQNGQNDHHNLLVTLIDRTLALPFGKAIMLFNLMKYSMTDNIMFPQISTQAKLNSLNTVVRLDMSRMPPDFIEWPEFHSGVAVGLNIKSGNHNIDSTWLTFNKPTDMHSQHAGFLFAQGLSSHLGGIAPWQSFNYLASKHSITAIGLLLGWASSCRGTMEPSITKLLSLHIPALLPPNSTELNHSLLTQISCIIGIGLLYQKSGNNMMTEKMLGEIERKEYFSRLATNSNMNENEVSLFESYSLAAGISLGMITLGMGGDNKIANESKIVFRLRNLLSPITSNQSQAKVLDASKVLNFNLTAPGAMMALTLMYLGTNSENVAKILELPDTEYNLQFSQPENLQLRVLGRSLIMWESIKASSSWVKSNIPAFILQKIESTMDFSQDDSHNDSIYLSRINIIAGSCLAIGLKYAGAQCKDVKSVLLKYYDQLSVSEKRHVVGSSFRMKIFRKTTLCCINTILLSLGLVCAGTGDIDIMKRLRVRYGRLGGMMSYGHHMVTSMTLGFLFLGGGQYSFRNDKESIASLLCAVYPKYPSSTHDNRTHLQALRHFWVHAIEKQCLLVRDVDTGSLVNLPVEIALNTSNLIKKSVSPCLLPPIKHIQQIQICSKSHFPIKIILKEQSCSEIKLFLETRTIYVKMRPLCTSSVELYKLSLSKELYNMFHANNNSVQPLSLFFKVDDTVTPYFLRFFEIVDNVRVLLQFFNNTDHKKDKYIGDQIVLMIKNMKLLRSFFSGKHTVTDSNLELYQEYVDLIFLKLQSILYCNSGNHTVWSKASPSLLSTLRTIIRISLVEGGNVHEIMGIIKRANLEEDVLLWYTVIIHVLDIPVYESNCISSGIDVFSKELSILQQWEKYPKLQLKLLNWLFKKEE